MKPCAGYWRGMPTSSNRWPPSWPVSRLQGLTQREIEIFLMLAKGTPTRLIAQQLCISAKTVSNYLTLLKSKLQVSSHAELVHLAIEAGLLRIAA